jgi:hypothetical protein
MRSIASAMGNERLIVATGIHQGIGKNGHALTVFYPEGVTC